MYDRVAVFCPAYCLTRNGSRLTHMNAMCVEKVIELVLEGRRADFLIFACAYHYWHDEAALKIRQALARGVSESQISVLEGITDRYDEIRKLKTLVKKHGITKIIAVAERYHMPSLTEAFSHELPELELAVEPVVCHQFEMSREPNIIKSIRAGSWLLWVVWNKIYTILTPLILKRHGKLRASSS